MSLNLVKGKEKRTSKAYMTHNFQGINFNLNGNHADLWQILVCIDQFAKPQSNCTAVLKKNNSSIEHRYQCIHVQSSSAAIMWYKIGWENKVLKTSQNVSSWIGLMWTCPRGCNQMTFPVTRNSTWIKLWIFIRDMVCHSSVQLFFSARNVEQTMPFAQKITDINTTFHILYTHPVTLSCYYSY